MTTVWFEGNYNHRKKGEKYRPAFYATYCDGCEQLLTKDQNKSITQEREELKELAITTKTFADKVKSYSDFRHFCSSNCEELYDEGKTNKRIQKNIAIAALESEQRKANTDYED